MIQVHQGSSRRLKVLMVAEVFPNHLMPTRGTFTLERARAMNRIAEVQVVAAVPYFPSLPLLSRFTKWHAWSQVEQFEVISGLPVYHPRRLVIPKLGGPLAGLLYARMLSATLRELRHEFKFDVIDSHFVWPDGYAASAIARELNVPLSITAQGTDLNLMPSFPSIRPLIQRALAQADRVLAVSQSLGDIALKIGADSATLRCIPNGVDINKFKAIDRDVARHDLGIKANETLLLSIGALIPRKGHNFLIEAMAILQQRGRRNLRLFILGEGPSRAKLEALIQKYRLEPCVRLRGQIPHEELNRWISAAALTCLTSSREGWPTVFFESWSCGVPVVATAVNGTPQAICSEDFGLLVDHQSPTLVADALGKALDKQWDPKPMMRHAAAHTWDHLASQIHREFRAIVPANIEAPYGDAEVREQAQSDFESGALQRLPQELLT